MKQSVNNIVLILMPNGQKLPIPQALNRAILHHQSGRLVPAIEIYRRILKANPVHADAMHLLGVSERQQGNYSEAIALIKKAIKIKPKVAAYFNNLSQSYRANGDLKNATVAGKKAVSLDSNMPEAYLNLGAIALENDDFDVAIESHNKAKKLRKNYVDAMIGLGDSLVKSKQFEAGLAEFKSVLAIQKNEMRAITRIGITLRMQDRVDDAINHYKLSIERFPSEVDLYNNLAFLFQRGGRFVEAAECLRKLLELTPDDVISRHTLNALEGSTAGSTPAEYVRELFDNYADNFESHLVEKLGYHIPEKLLEVIINSVGKRKNLSALDLGCGTGLMGIMLEDYCSHLAGVDLAPKMIEHARDKNIYDELAVGDVLEFMQKKESARYDIIVAADVFNYIGELDAIFNEAKRLLSSDGVFSFSVEAADNDSAANYQLNETVRYSHAKKYLQQLQLKYGFKEREFVREHMRNNHGKPVYGFMCVYSLV